ncbi:MAG: TRAP transporter small permease [Eubacterium sp.]|nr:TRAP transporter small permease [Eubacterium sp.]
MEALHKIRRVVDLVLSSACAVIFAAMVVIGSYQIITRFIFKSPSTVSEELLTYSFTWMALLASAYVFGKRDHMRMGFMADKAGPGGQKVLSMISEVLIMLLAASVMIYGGVTIMDLTMTQSTASLGIPMGVVYTIIPISGVLIVFYAVLNLADLITGAAPQKAKDA